MGFGRSSIMVVSLREKHRSPLLRRSLGHRGRPTVTTLGKDSSTQMERPAQILALQHAPEPVDLVRGLEKRVFTVNGDVLSLDDILNLADRFGRDVPDALDMPWNEQQVVRIDMPLLDEAPGLLRAATRGVLVHQTALVVHEAVKVAAGPGQSLAEGVGGHVRLPRPRPAAGPEDFALGQEQ